MLHCCCGCCCIAVLLYLWYNSVVRLSQAEERPSSSHTSGPVPYLSTKGSEKNVRITVVVATVFTLLLPNDIYLDQTPPQPALLSVVYATLLMRLLLCWYVQLSGAIVPGACGQAGCFSDDHKRKANLPHADCRCSPMYMYTLCIPTYA